MREAALAEADARMAEDPRAIEPRFDRARLLTELGREEEAKRAYLDIVALSPGHFGALNNLGALLFSTGFRTAARTCYAEATLRHPGNPAGHVNFANALLENGELESARAHFETALKLDPDQAEAHQGFANLLRELGEEEVAEQHRRIGFRDRAITVLPYRGEAEPVPAILFVSGAGGNAPIGPFLDDHIYLVTVIVADYFDAVTLPPHRLIVNAIGDADLCMPALNAAARLAASSRAPIINDPSAVLVTGRVPNAARLARLPDVITAAMADLPRETLAAPGAIADLATRGFVFPFLLRRPGFHNGRDFLRIESAADLASALEMLRSRAITVMQFLDARSADGKIRKYRVMMIGGDIYPLHAAVARQWKIHYVTADMAENPEHRAEDEAFLNDMPAVLGTRAMKALERIRDALDLDYAGVDFSLDGDRQVLLFEANATMVIAPPGLDPRWNYRQGPTERILNAVRRMIAGRAGI